MVKRIRSNYHTLQVLNTADPKLRKAILANCKRELVKTLSECSLNLLRGNVKVDTVPEEEIAKIPSTPTQASRYACFTKFQEESHCSARRFLTPSPRRSVANYRQSNIQAVRDMLRKM